MLKGTKALIQHVDRCLRHGGDKKASQAEEEPSFPNKSPSLKGRAVTEEEEPGSEVQLGPWDLLLNTLPFSANLTIPATPTGVSV